MSHRFTTTLSPESLASDSPRVREVLETAKKQVGFIPNMYTRMVNVPGLLETYLLGYDRFRKESGLTSVEQEVVFLTVSHQNRCHYCVAAHSFLADKKSGVPPEVTDAIRDGVAIPDEKLQALSEFTRAIMRAQGWLDRSDVEPFLAAGYSERHILAIILAVAVKTLSNWSNHLFDTPVDEMFAGRRWSDAGVPEAV